MKRKIIGSIISLILTGVMFSQSIPMTLLKVLADGEEETYTKEEVIERKPYAGDKVDKYNIGSGYILQENVERRTATTKEYIMSDNTIMVQQYVEPIHYLEEGEYKEIDNTLIEEGEEGVYTNKGNSFKVKFNKGKVGNVEIEEEGYEIKFEYKGEYNEERKGEIRNTKEEKKERTKRKKQSRPDKPETGSGEISYGLLEADVELKQKVKNNKLSNELIIKEKKEEYKYSFKLESSNLKFEQSEEGSIYASNSSGQTKFILKAPYIIDGNGVYSNAIRYEIIEKAGELEITLVGDAEWINTNATFPLKIKPEIESVKKDRFEYANVYENGGKITNGEKVYVGKKNGIERSEVYLSFKFPEVEPYYQLIGASLNLECEATQLGETLEEKEEGYNVYVAKSTEDLSTITYTSAPEKVQELNDIKNTTESTTQTMSYKSDIIDPYRLENDTLTIGIAGTETTENSYIALSTSSETTSATYWYQRVMGIEDEYSMESFEINGAMAYNNNGTGQLTATFNLASVNTLLDMPFEASLIYNDYYNEVLDDLGKMSICGNNFKLNFQQYMIAHDGVYELIDADGSISTFYGLGSGIYYSKEKELYYNSASKVVYDLVGNQMLFEGGRLKEIVSQSNPTEFISIIYVNNSDQISEVRYYANTEVKYKISFTYSNDRIETVTTNADTTTPLKKTLQYDEDGNLISIKNKTNNEVGVETLKFGYEQRYTNEYPVILNSIYNNQKEGIIFDRLTNYKVYKVRNINGESATSETRCYTSVDFSYYGIYTKIYYYENNKITNMRYVSFNNSKEVIAEWAESATGIVSLQASTNWTSQTSAEPEAYTKMTCTYLHKVLPLDGESLSANGGHTTHTVNASSLRLENNSNYRFAVIFKVGTSEGEDQLLAGLDLSVQIGLDTHNISLEYGGSTYVVIPCGYYSSDTAVLITNNGTENVAIEYFNYTLVSSEEKSYTYDAGIQAHRLTSTTIGLESGEVTTIQYDDKQRVDLVERKDVFMDRDEFERTNYYYYEMTESVLGGLKPKQVVTETCKISAIENNIPIIEVKGKIAQTDYTYTGSRNADTGALESYTETVISEQQGSKTKTVYNIDRVNKTVTQTDENNITTQAKYEATQGDNRLREVTYGNTREVYTYNNFGEITSVNVYDEYGALILSQTDNYDANGVYLGSNYGGATYGYTYDTTGFVTVISEQVGTTPAENLLTYTYNTDGDSPSANKLSVKTYANGDTENYNYGATQTTLTYKKGDVEQGKYVYNYNSKGAMTSQGHTVNNQTQLFYNYGALDNMEQQTLTISGLEFYTEYTKDYDVRNNRIKNTYLYSTIRCSATDYKTTHYSYNTRGEVSGISYASMDIGYTYDHLTRIKNKTASNYSRTVQNESYAYETYTSGENTYETNFLTCIDDETSVNNDRTATYDANGYVTGISYNGNTYTYTYDGAGRLLSETTNTSTKTYSYDSNNNIQISGFEYTNGRLTSVNGATIAYDKMGNPTTYKGNSFTWEQGRKLVGGSINGNAFTYTYDGNGMRYEKVVNGTKTNYYYDGTQLLMESKNGYRIWYLYGVTGIEGMVCKNAANEESVYYYDKNILGDIIAIRDESGNVVALYEYDAWGNVTVMDGDGYNVSTPTFIGNVNPFRYRGYYYDNETGFYYLQTRYYDPSICRFINADNYELVATLADTIGQLNMYAYCGNNPIMYTDETGCFWDNFIIRVEILIDTIQEDFDRLKTLPNNIVSSFYCNFGVGTGLGLSTTIGPLQFGAIAAFSFGMELLPVPEVGCFQRFLIEVQLFTIGLAYGTDEFSKIGEPINGDFNPSFQDVTIGINYSEYFFVGGFFEYGFNLSKFSRLMGW